MMESSQFVSDFHSVLKLSLSSLLNNLILSSNTHSSSLSQVCIQLVKIIMDEQIESLNLSNSQEDPLLYFSSLNNSSTRSHNLHYNWQKSFTQFMVLSVVAVISSSFNIVSIYLISRKKRLRVVDYLVCNLSLSTFFMCLVMVMKYPVPYLFHALGLPQGWMCGFTNYLKYFPGVVITLSSFGISFERIRSLKVQRGRTDMGKVIKAILLIWVFAAIITFPAAFRAAFDPNKVKTLSPFDMCRRIPLFNSKFVDVLYELLNFFFLHLLFSSFLLYELYLIRSKIKYLFVSSIPNEKMQRKVLRVRFAFFYSIILILVWISSGIVHLNYKIPIWFSSSTKMSSKSLTFLKMTTLLYLLVNPIVVFLSNEGLKILRNFCPCLHTLPPKVVTKTEENANGQVRIDDTSTAFNTDGDVSRFATATVSSLSENNGYAKVDTYEEGESSVMAVTQIRIHAPES